MEVQQKQTMDRKDKIQIAFLGIMLFCAFALLFAGIKVVKYHEMLSNPLGYNLDKFDVASCTCYKNNGEVFKVNAISKGDSNILQAGSNLLNNEMIISSGG